MRARPIAGLGIAMMVMLLLVATLAWTTWIHRPHAGAIVLQVPATHLSVGQQFRPQVLSLAAEADGGSSSLALELTDGAGHVLVDEPLQLPDGGTVTAAPLSLPREGQYEIRVTGATAPAASLRLQASPEPGTGFGGITALAGFGLPTGVADYLRQHGYAVTSAGDASLEGEKLILTGDPRGNGANLDAAYDKLWHAVADGANLLLLEPLAPGVADYWPRLGPLQPAASACGVTGDDPELGDGLPAEAVQFLHPNLIYDVSAQSALDLYRLDGTRLLRPDARSGYRGCHAILSYRYGAGWVTLSTVPVIQHFQDVRSRIFLLNLIRAATRRRRRAPASPGLAWVTRERLRRLAKAPPQPLRTNAALFYREAPRTATSPAPYLVPIGAPGAASCWVFKGDGPGASVELELEAAQMAGSLTLSLGGPEATWPRFRLEGKRASAKTSWLGIPNGPIGSDGGVQVALPDAGQAWQAFRLTLTAPPPATWKLCGFSVQR
ncbi:MAG: hypothetical protein ACRD2D_08360 [Terriglobales bacterium]